MAQQVRFKQETVRKTQNSSSFREPRGAQPKEQDFVHQVGESLTKATGSNGYLQVWSRGARSCARSFAVWIAR